MGDAFTALLSDAAAALRPKRSSSSLALRLALSAAASRSASSASLRSRAFSAALCISAVCWSWGGAAGIDAAAEARGKAVWEDLDGAGGKG